MVQMQWTQDNKLTVFSRAFWKRGWVDPVACVGELAATMWVAERVVIEDLEGFSDDQAYRAMDFLLDALQGGT